jgi:hypothetical protein
MFDKHIAIFVPGRLYRNNRYCFDFLQTLKEKLLAENIKPIFFASLSQECDVPSVTEEFGKLFNIIPEEQLNLESVHIPSDIYNFPKRPETDYENTFRMFYHNYRCFQMIQKYSKKNNINFDYVIKWRTDIKIYKNFNELCDSIISLSKNDEIKNENAVYVPAQDMFWGISDQLAFGNYRVMNIYCQCVLNIHIMCHSGIIYHPETLLYNHCKLNNLYVKNFDAFYHVL